MTLKAPFPWFGGKSRVSHIVWPRFGDTINYVEPFAGSLAVLLKRPFPVRTETVNDKDAYLANFWRAVTYDPDAVAHYADWPVNEADLHARHLWLVNQADFRKRMMTDPEYYDPKIAGWWVWGQSCWIGSGWCAVSDAQEMKRPHLTKDGVHAIAKKRPNLPQEGGRGVTATTLTRNGRSRPSLRPGQGVESVTRKAPRLSGFQGATKQLPEVTYVRGGHRAHESGLYAYMRQLQQRLRRVRVVCGDWTRIMGPSPTYKIGITAVFLDPPYGNTRQDKLYAQDSLILADEVRNWCLETITDGKFRGPRYLHPKLRIALCGLAGEHDDLHERYGWDVVAWKTVGGYGNQRKGGSNENASRERIWFSPNCLPALDNILQAKSGVVDDWSDLALFGGSQ